MKNYDPKKIELKWQKEWEKKKVYQAKDNKKKKFYSLVEFPYPSGDGLHVGHPRSYVGMDVISRKKRMEGLNVLYPMGWDAFGLPTENYAIKTGKHPKIITKKNTDNFRRQIKMLGISFDWSREINTTDPEYYKWTQWIFLQFFKKGLAYKKETEINWCPSCKIGLANEESVGGICERCGGQVEKRMKSQWMLGITKYAERLDKDLDLVDYPERVKNQQRNWIGKSEGSEFDFPVFNSKIKKFVILHGRNGTPQKNFIPWLKKNLEEKGFEVDIPILPNTNNPNDIEQTDFIVKNVHLNENTVIVGHSFGGVVAMRLLERGIKVNGVIFIGTPTSGNFTDGRDRFTVTEAVKRGFNYEKIKKQADYFKVLFDLNDSILPKKDGEFLAEKLGTFCESVIAERAHFTGEEEPEILEDIIPKIKVFTTRADTLFGATYVVLAPEHELVQKLLVNILNKNEVEKYISDVKKKTDLERAENKIKTGVELKGIKAINPANNEEIPVWVADYVLPHYGTGAVMAVPQHDQRDRDFAEKFNLPIIDRPLVNVEEIIKKVGGKIVTKFKLRDWVFSRQRYWGEPIPLINCVKCGWVSVPEKDLPVKLPEVKSYKLTDTGESPLAGIIKWVNTKCPKCDGEAKRETDTMPNWAGSSWYYLRYTDPKNKKVFADKKKLKYWTPIDWYNGGMEHTTLHLLYSRFWHKFLYDLKLVPTVEPYKKRTSHGMILGEGGVKMSKSLGNVVNPDEIVKIYGADTLRVYEMFLGPFEDTAVWNTESIIGSRRFLEKVWRIGEKVKNSKKMLSCDSHSNLNVVNERNLAYVAENTSLNFLKKLLHKTIKKVSEDIEAMRFNTAISAMMILAGEMEKIEKIDKDDFKKFLQILSPFAPHVTDEIWHLQGEKNTISLSKWPEWDEKLIKDTEIKIVVQVNGKVRTEMMIEADGKEEDIKKKAIENETISKFIEGKEIKKIIYVKNRLINIVI